MRNIILIASLFTLHITYGQNYICKKCYETDLRSLVIKPDSFQRKGDWLSSIEFNKKKMLDSITVYDNYRLAASYSMINNFDSAFKYLNRFIDISTDDRCIIVDKKFDNLKKNIFFWESVIRRIEHGYLTCLDSMVNKEYALKLFYLGIKDQKYRKYYPILQQPFEPEEWPRNDLQNDSIFTAMVKKYGFPTLSKVGRLATNAGFLIVQHGNTKYKHYREVIKAYKRNDYESILFAKVVDRWRTEHNRKQIYGTSWHRSTETSLIYGDKWVLEPVKDFRNLNKRRHSIGLCPIEEELEKDTNQIIPKEYYRK